MSSNGETNSCPIGSPQSVAQSVDEAAEEYLPGMAQLKVAERAVLLEDMRYLAQADREKVRKLEAKKLWGTSDVNDVKEPEMGDLIVTGDIHVGSRDQAKVPEKLLSQPQLGPTKSKIPDWAKVVSAVLLGSGLGVGGLTALNALKNTAEEPPVSAVQQAADRWNEYDIEKWIPKPETREE